jgi:hypothetical protein
MVNTPMLCANAKGQQLLFSVIPAKAGIQSLHGITKTWTPFFNGVTACSETIKNLESQNRLDHPALFHIFYRRVDFIEWIEGDQFVERELPLAVEVEELGDE